MDNLRKTNLTKYDCFLIFKIVTLFVSLFSIPVWGVAGFIAPEALYYELPFSVSDYSIYAAVLLLYFLGLGASIAGIVMEMRGLTLQRNLRIVSNICFAVNILHLLTPIIALLVFMLVW